MISSDSIAGFGSPDAWRRALALLTGALVRRRISVATVTLLFAAAGCAAAVALPRTYWAESSLLVTRNSVMPALANPKRAIPMGADVPLQTAVDVTLSRPSLERILRAEDLLGRWRRDRAGLMLVKDSASEWLKGPVPEDERIDALVELLTQRIVVSVNNDVVSVKASWTDRRTAFDLVNQVVETFLDVRRQTDVQVIADTSQLIERKAAMERARIDQSLAAAGDRRVSEPVGAPVAAAPLETPAPARDLHAVPAVAVGSGRSDVSPTQEDGLTALRARLLQVQTRREEIEKRQREKVAELEARLADQRGTQTDRHPDMVAMRRTLDDLRTEPEGLRQTRDQETRLLAEIVARSDRAEAVAPFDPEPESAPDAFPQAVQAAANWSSASPGVDASEPDEDADAVVYARTLFKGSLDSYQELIARLGDVQIELETAKASFGARYAVVKPARLPKRASSPNVPLVVLGAVFAGLLAGVLGALFTELRDLSLLSPVALVRHIADPQETIAA